METLKGSVSCKGLICFLMCEETRSITSLLSLAAYDKPIVSSPSLSLPPLPPPPRVLSVSLDGDRDNDDNDWCVGGIVALYSI